MIDCPESLKKGFSSSEALFDEFMSLPGILYRIQKNRSTKKIEWQGTSYFLKQHRGVSIKELFKNLLQGRLPIINATKEWQALKALRQANVPVPQPLAYGKRGCNPLTQESFILMEAIAHEKELDTFCREHPVPFKLKQHFIQEVATIIKKTHALGIHHRDCYLCHFLLVKNGENALPTLYLIDWHRATINQPIQYRAQLKDLAALYFSSIDKGFSTRDYCRFLKIYFDKPLRDIFTHHQKLITDIQHRGIKLYYQHMKK